MAFRKTRHADAEPAPEYLPRTDETHQLLGITEGIPAAVVVRPVLRQISAEGEDVLDARGFIAIEDRGISSAEWQTHVRCDTAVRLVSLWMRTIRSCVRSRVAPPAP